MTQQDTSVTEHEIEVAAPAGTVYRLLADVANWPQIFPPTIYAEQIEQAGDSERIRIWATANGELKNWTSRRVLDPAAQRIDFRQEVSAHPVAAMGGTWIIESLPGDSTRIRLLHDFRAVDDDPDSLDWIATAVDRNSRSELAALKTQVELAHAARDLTFSFTDTIEVAGRASDVYDFINEAALWADRLPHVASVRLEERVPGLQTLEMDTRAKDGSTHTTVSHRVCLQPGKIAYKQVTLPALLNLHTGRWTFSPHDGGCTASSQHTVVLNDQRIAGILGADATVADAREYVRTALSTNSRATLGYARDYAERRR
jgi:aromatase